MKWATAAELSIDDDDADTEDEDYRALSSLLYMALVLMCKGHAFTMIRSMAGNNGIEAWRILNAFYDPGSKGR